MDDIFEQKRFAVLVDGDNAQPSLLDQVLFEAAKYGRITIKRIYGDWTTPNMNGWRNSLIELAMQPVQQFRNTVGKNATDSAMISECEARAGDHGPGRIPPKTSAAVDSQPLPFGRDVTRNSVVAPLDRRRTEA